MSNVQLENFLQSTNNVCTDLRSAARLSVIIVMVTGQNSELLYKLINGTEHGQDLFYNPVKKF